MQLPPNSTAAQSVGLLALRPELSQNYSVGFVAHPIDNLQITLDAYQINIHKRILVSGFIYGTSTDSNGNIQLISQGVLDAITRRGVTLDSGLSYTGISVFANSANTRTDGIELTANYASDFGDYGHVDWTLGANYNKTQITKSVQLPPALRNANPPPGTIPAQINYFTPNTASALTTATPREKVILQAYYTNHKFSVNLRETIYGHMSQFTADTIKLDSIPTTAITDLDIGYRVTSSIKVDVGANNLFNQFPPRGFPVSGGRVFNVPYDFAPWGGNGGYYYGRVVVTF